VYKLRNGLQGDPVSIYDDGLIGWRKIAIRPQEGVVEWQYDDHGGLQGMVHQAPPNYASIPIPIEKMVLFRTKEERGDPEGYSLLRNAYLPWLKTKNVEWLEGVGVERDLAGIPVVQPAMGVNWSTNSPERAAAKKLSERIRQDEQSGITLPPPKGPEDHQKWHVTLLSSPGSKQFDTDKIVNRLSNEIAVSILMGFIRFGLQGTAGTYNLARDARDLFHLAMVGMLNGIEDIINRFMVRPLFVLNPTAFGKLTALPTLQHGEVGKQVVAEVAEAIGKAVKDGLILPDPAVEEFVRGLLGLPEKPKESKVKVDTKKESERFTEEELEGLITELTEADTPEHWEAEEGDDDIDWTADGPGIDFIAEYVTEESPLSFAVPKKTPLQLLRKNLDGLAKDMDKLAFDLKEGRITHGRFMGEFQSNLQESLRQGLRRGQRRLTPDTTAIPRAARRNMVKYSNRQIQYFKGLLKDVDSMSAAQLSQRSQMYVQSGEGLYNETVIKGLDMEAKWNLSEAVHCPDCLERDGKTWPTKELPFVPRDGNSQCIMNCKCYLTYSKKAGR
ncbi:hypothetical protein LCGC14_1794040, partial [marine sediment metagenome]